MENGRKRQSRPTVSGATGEGKTSKCARDEMRGDEKAQPIPGLTCRRIPVAAPQNASMCFRRVALTPPVDRQSYQFVRYMMRTMVVPLDLSCLVVSALACTAEAEAHCHVVPTRNI